tara:strand:+ start:71 stop:3088 length:3018 start_codon:yes stop_codon:yes gene_type:complete
MDDGSYNNMTEENCEDQGGSWAPNVLNSSCSTGDPAGSMCGGAQYGCANIHKPSMTSCAAMQEMNCLDDGYPMICPSECNIVGQKAYKFSGAMCEDLGGGNYGCGQFNPYMTQECIYGCDENFEDCAGDPCDSPSQNQDDCIDLDEDGVCTIAEQCPAYQCDCRGNNSNMSCKLHSEFGCNGLNWMEVILSGDQTDYCEYVEYETCSYGCDSGSGECLTYCNSLMDDCPSEQCVCQNVRGRGKNCYLYTQGYCDTANDRCTFGSRTACDHGCQWDATQCENNMSECCAVDPCDATDANGNLQISCEDKCLNGTSYVHYTGVCQNGECERDDTNYTDGVEVCYWGVCDDDLGCYSPYNQEQGDLNWCEEESVPNCHQGNDPGIAPPASCCPVSWVGDTWPDCSVDTTLPDGPLAYGCDLTCWECEEGGVGSCTRANFNLSGNDGGDCDEEAHDGLPHCQGLPYNDTDGNSAESTINTGTCGSCVQPYGGRENHGVCCCDSAAVDISKSCADLQTMNGDHPYDCSGCRCPLDPCYNHVDDNGYLYLKEYCDNRGLCGSPEDQTNGGCFYTNGLGIDHPGTYETAWCEHSYTEVSCPYGCNHNGCYDPGQGCEGENCPEWTFFENAGWLDTMNEHTGESSNGHTCEALCAQQNKTCYGDYATMNFWYGEPTHIYCGEQSSLWPLRCETPGPEYVRYCLSHAIGLFSLDYFPNEEDCAGDWGGDGWSCATNGDVCGPVLLGSRPLDTDGGTQWNAGGPDVLGDYTGGVLSEAGCQYVPNGAHVLSINWNDDWGGEGCGACCSSSHQDCFDYYCGVNNGAPEMYQGVGQITWRPYGASNHRWPNMPTIPWAQLQYDDFYGMIMGITAMNGACNIDITNQGSSSAHDGNIYKHTMDIDTVFSHQHVYPSKSCCCGDTPSQFYCGDGRTRWSYSLGREVASAFKTSVMHKNTLLPLSKSELQSLGIWTPPPVGWEPKGPGGVPMSEYRAMMGWKPIDPSSVTNSREDCPWTC